MERITVAFSNSVSHAAVPTGPLHPAGARIGVCGTWTDHDGGSSRVLLGPSAQPVRQQEIAIEITADILVIITLLILMLVLLGRIPECGDARAAYTLAGKQE